MLVTYCYRLIPQHIVDLFMHPSPEINGQKFDFFFFANVGILISIILLNQHVAMSICMSNPLERKLFFFLLSKSIQDKNTQLKRISTSHILNSMKIY